ncbi:MAG TPA: hypothetical protein DDY78_26680 [Planctomycetales bacterium]|nr:hypothetical protein [Planctomycetales bacterium]
MKLKLTIISGPHQGREFVFDGHDTFLVGRTKEAHPIFRLFAAARVAGTMPFQVFPTSLCARGGPESAALSNPATLSTHQLRRYE